MHYQFLDKTSIFSSGKTYVYSIEKLNNNQLKTSVSVHLQANKIFIG
jgi:hypothetical protein